MPFIYVLFTDCDAYVNKKKEEMKLLHVSLLHVIILNTAISMPFLFLPLPFGTAIPASLF